MAVVQNGAYPDKERKQPSATSVTILTTKLFNNLPTSGEAKAFSNPAEVIAKADAAFRDNTEMREAIGLNNTNPIDPTADKTPRLAPISFGGLASYVTAFTGTNTLPLTEVSDHVVGALNNYDTNTGNAPTLEGPEMQTYNDGLPLGELQPTIRDPGAEVTRADVSLVTTTKQLAEMSDKQVNIAMWPPMDDFDRETKIGMYAPGDVRNRGTYIDPTDIMKTDSGLSFPLPGGPSNYRITNKFAPYARHPHKGIDIAALEVGMIKGTPILAVAAGTITSGAERGGWIGGGGGWAVEIEHGNGFRSSYMHLLHSPTVSLGDHVEAGTPLGLVGESGGTSTGPHLHFELYRVAGEHTPAWVRSTSNYINPAPMIGMA